MCQINSVPMKYAIGYLDILTPPTFEEPEAVSGPSGAQLTVSEGSNATLSCRATGHPTPVISWRREDNEPILLANQLESASSKAEGASLVLGQVSRLHSGAYLCIASNGVQPAASRRQLLDVQYKPIIRLPQTEVGARLGQPEVQLTCHVELNPLGSYHWVKLGGGRSSANVENIDHLLADDLALIEQDELTNSDKFDIVMRQVDSEKVQMTLSLRQVDRRDFGQYRCIARNALGHQSNTIRLYESSSFSLNSMFRTAPEPQANQTSSQAAPSSWQDQPEEPPDTAGRPKSGSGSGSRTHTRSSWIQRPNGGSAPTKALLDSRTARSGGSSSSRWLTCASDHLPLMLLLLLLSSCWLSLPHHHYHNLLLRRF